MAQLAQAVHVEVVTFWYCPNCEQRDVTREARPHTRFHSCTKLFGMVAPMFPEGTKVKVYAREREDYIGEDHGRVFLNTEGRPIMSVITERDDGQDAIVFAPTATARV